jgi:PAS domain S-box-containing protein
VRCVALFGLAAMFFCTPLTAAEAPAIRVGSELDFRPYVFTDRDGQPSGFGVELLKAVADKMGLPLRITPGPWDQVWNGLVAGELDVLPVVARTPGREPLVDFSLPHTETFDAFFRRTGQPALPHLAAAAGKEIVVLRSDAAHHQLVERQFAGKVIPVDSIPAGLRLIAAGKHDALLCSKLIGTLELEQAGIRGVTAGPPIPDYKRVFSFAVHKGNAELLEKLNQGLLIIKSTGEYDDIYGRWLAVEHPWRKWAPYFWWGLGGLVVLTGWVCVLQWLVHRRTRQLAHANKEIESELAERRKAEMALQQMNETLEQHIQERTAALRESEQRYRTLFESIDEGFCIIEVIFDGGGKAIDYRFLATNPAFDRQTGLTNVSGRRMRELAPQHEDHWFETYGGIALTGQPARFEDRAEQLGRWYDVYAFRHGRPEDRHVAVLFNDITQRKQAEETLRQSNQHLEQRVTERTAELARAAEKVQAERKRFLDVLETLPVIVALFRPDHRVVWINQAYREALGDCVGQLCYAGQFGRDKPCEECQAFLPLQTGQPHNWEWTLPDGRTFDIYNFPFADADGSPMILEMDMDITARRQAEAALAERTAEAQHRAEQLRALAVQLSEAEQKERQRLALLLHDGLQQILVGTKFHVGILRSQLSNPQQREILKQVDDLLDESLDASRGLTVDLSPPILQHGTMAQVLQWLADWMRRKHGLVVKVQVDEKAHPQAPEIRTLLFQVVRELLFNAVKHAEVDRADVELSCVDGGQIKVVVRDAGKGFDPSRLHTSKGHGSGFGLFSIRERMDWLGGRLEIESAPGEGTHAIVIVPMRLRTTPQAVPAVVAIAAPAAQLGGNGRTGGILRVLLVDDHAVVRDGLSSLLQRQADIEVVGQAADGCQAVEQALQTQPDVVIMDVNMPGMDGKEATRQILARLPNVKVIGLSMFAESDVAEAMKTAGAVAYLAKTSGPDALIAAIRSCTATPARV